MIIIMKIMKKINIIVQKIDKLKIDNNNKKNGIKEDSRISN